jgi:hypothetical protein
MVILFLRFSRSIDERRSAMLKISSRMDGVYDYSVSPHPRVHGTSYFPFFWSPDHGCEEARKSCLDPVSPISWACYP